jgi:hypothetical protein
MSVLRFRRDRRQRDPFAASPATPRRPAQQQPPAYDSRIDPEETLAGLVAQAQAETAQATPWGPWDQPGSFPDAMRAENLSDEHGRWYGWGDTSMDNPPAHDRPYIPGVLGAEGRLSPRSAGIADDLGSLLVFRAAVERMARPCCPDCQQAAGTWQERLYGTFRHHTWPVPEAAPREFGIATELRQAHGATAADADRAEHAFASRYLARRAA